MAESNQFVQATTHSIHCVKSAWIVCVCKSCLLLARDVCKVAWYPAVLSLKHNNIRSTILSVVMLLVHVVVSWFTTTNGKLGRGLGMRLRMLKP